MLFVTVIAPIVLYTDRLTTVKFSCKRPSNLVLDYCSFTLLPVDFNIGFSFLQLKAILSKVLQLL